MLAILHAFEMFTMRGRMLESVWRYSSFKSRSIVESTHHLPRFRVRWFKHCYHSSTGVHMSFRTKDGSCNCARVPSRRYSDFSSVSAVYPIQCLCSVLSSCIWCYACTNRGPLKELHSGVTVIPRRLVSPSRAPHDALFIGVEGVRQNVHDSMLLSNFPATLLPLNATP